MDDEHNFEQMGEGTPVPVALPRRGDYLLPGSILMAGILISGSIIYVVGKQSGNAALNNTANQLAQVGSAPKVSERDVVLGDAKAPVTFIEYGDYQCPFCGRFFSETEPLLRDNYVKTGKIKMVFRDFSFLGPESLAAAEAAECAKDQQQFWPYHDALYQAENADGHENSGNLNKDLFVKIAGDLKLDAKAFTQCLDSQKYAKQVQSDTENGASAGVNSTPTSFVNDQKLLGALPYAQFQSVIDGILSNK